jgi:uncharacterized Zn finger protein
MTEEIPDECPNCEVALTAETIAHDGDRTSCTECGHVLFPERKVNYKSPVQHDDVAPPEESSDN